MEMKVHRFRNHQAEEGEALNLVNEIRELITNRGYEYKDIAILYRANFQSRFPEESFAQNKIPYFIENGLNFYQRSEVRYLLDYLRLIVNPDSEEGNEALKTIINVPNRYVSRKFMQELTDFSNGKNVHLYEGLKPCLLIFPMSGRTSEISSHLLIRWWTMRPISCRQRSSRC